MMFVCLRHIRQMFTHVKHRCLTHRGRLRERDRQHERQINSQTDGMRERDKELNCIRQRQKKETDTCRGREKNSTRETDR